MIFPEGVIPDGILLKTLNNCLDEISQKLLQQKREEDPAISFKEFWSILQNEFSGDVSQQQRNLWKQVKLDSTPPLTVEKWRKFHRELELRTIRVSDWNENE